MNVKTRKLTVAAMFSALAFATAAIFNIIPIPLVPSLPFLHYDPKDVLITLCGFILGPMYAVLVSLVDAMIEMSVSSTGVIGALMNFLSSCIYACSAALLYKRMRNVKGAVLGLIVSVASTTCFMLLWNYLISPLYMGISREAVGAMLFPAFLPFNLVKCSINAGIVLLVYKPVITILRRIGLVEKNNKSVTVANTALALTIGVLLVAAGLAAVWILNRGL